MATIMSWGNSSGAKGRCDASCHNAKYPKCVCMCGGKMHSSANRAGGVEQAVKEHWEEILDEAEKKAEEEGLELETERWTKNRQRILGELPTKPKPVKTEIATQGRLPLEVA